ncbi:pirin-like protein [Elaeis guineensis]|uniref:pirin-like protein n=1 Tax=Elaeis guineensis var. tenera TaxID=51953 RepID=UPI003C6D107C
MGEIPSCPPIKGPTSPSLSISPTHLAPSPSPQQKEPTRPYKQSSSSPSKTIQHFVGPQSLREQRRVMAETEMSPVLQKPRQVVRKFQARPQHEGDGAVVRRSIGRFELKYFDPFLVLDEFSVAAPAGFPDHPHRGFETVTYMLEGAVTHEDFEGHKGTIMAGDLQWMTAGRGIVHSEMPAGQGISKGLQLWVNLSSKNKMIEPRYQEIQSNNIASTAKNGIEVRVIAGESMGVQSPVYTRTPTMYLDFKLRQSAHLRQPIPPTWNSFVYVLEGEGVFCSEKNGPVGPHHILLLGQGDGLEVWNRSSKPLRFLLIGGEPLGEPVAQLGPFVMNTEEEIDRTIDDYQYFVNGFEKAKYWRSEGMAAP